MTTNSLTGKLLNSNLRDYNTYLQTSTQTSIQDSYDEKNGDMSKHYHDISNKEIESYHDIKGSDVIKSIIFGGLDGLVTVFSIFCSSYAAHLDFKIIIILGFANLFGAAISMGHGDYFSEKTEQDYIMQQYEREQWEMNNYLDGEINEMKDIYIKQYNVKESDANTILNLMSRYNKLFLDHMMVLELGLMPPDNSINPIKNGIVTFFSFIIFGSIPLILYIIFNNVYISFIGVILTLAFLGYIRANFTKKNKIVSCIITIMNGCISAIASYGVSYGLDQLLQ